MADETVTTYAHDGWWWNRVGGEQHDEDTALRFDTLDEAARIGRLIAQRRGVPHLIRHT